MLINGAINHLGRKRASSFCFFILLDDRHVDDIFENQLKYIIKENAQIKIQGYKSQRSWNAINHNGNNQFNREIIS